MSLRNFIPYSELEAASITGTYQNLIAPLAPYQIIQVFNDLDEAVELSFDGGTTSTHKLNGEGFVLDLSANAGCVLAFPVMVRHVGTPPTVGSIRASVLL